MAHFTSSSADLTRDLTKRWTVTPEEVESRPVTLVDYVMPNGANVTVAREDLLLGGTKTRGVAAYLADIPSYRPVYYVGTTNALGPLALTLVANRSHHVILHLIGRETNMTQCARENGASVHLHESISMTCLRERVHLQNPEAQEISFGMKDEIFSRALLENLRRNFPASCQPRRVWVACESCVLLNVLAELFPAAEFFAIRVGIELYEDLLPPGRKITVFDAKKIYRYFEEVKNIDRPPWPSMPSYDAKIYKFAREFAEDGDLIWNVGTTPKISIEIGPSVRSDVANWRAVRRSSPSSSSSPSSPFPTRKPSSSSPTKSAKSSSSQRRSRMKHSPTKSSPTKPK